MNSKDCEEFDLIEGDLISLINEEADNRVYTRLFVSNKIPRDSIALGDNLLDNLGVVNEDLIEVKIYNKKVHEASEIAVEFNSQDYNFEGLKFNNQFRNQLIEFLNKYYQF